jgi:uncharacterized glyoxalase superfamily protein PhnB
MSKKVKRVKEVKKSRASRAKTASRAKKASPAKKSSPAKKAASAKRADKGVQLTSIVASLTVDDVAKSMTWYCDILGFTVKQRWERDGVLNGGELKAGPVSLYIGGDDWKMGRDRVKGQGVRLWWYTNQDLDKLANDIKARGGVLVSEPKDEYGMRSFSLVDPTGYKITIASNK